MPQSRYGVGTRRITGTVTDKKRYSRDRDKNEYSIQPARDYEASSYKRAKTYNSSYSKKYSSSSSFKSKTAKDNSVNQNTKKQSGFQNFKAKLVKSGEIDYTLLFIVVLIVAIGLIVMLSASAPAGSTKEDNAYYFFTRQLLFIVAGFIGMYIVSKVDLNKFIPYIPKMFIICVILLILVLIPGIGVEANGARRWLNIPLFQPQPSEFMKPVIAMYIAYLVHIKLIDLKKLKSNIACLGIIGIPSFLLMMETHLSGTIITIGIAACVMIAGGTPVKPLILAGLGCAVLVFVYLQFDQTRMERITSFFDPFADAQDSGYQITQSIYAIASGRLFGLGLGQSVQKYSHLPEPYNDFIFSIVCEELGFFGAVIIILLFVALFLRAMKIAINAPDVWSSLTCIGIAAQLGIQTFLNMGVAISLIPNTGVSLPFFSYGGASILTLLLEIGILLNVSRKSVKE